MTVSLDHAARPPRSERMRAGLLMTATVVAFCLPSSVGGAILRSLTIVSLLLTCGLLGALAVQRRGLGSPLLLLTAGAMIGLLLIFTIVSPFREFSPGAIFIYAGIALLYALNVREVVRPRTLQWFFAAINVWALGLGFATALNMGWADRLLTQYYNAFYPDLLPNMVIKADKPVLSFATHSMAGFMIYLFFYMNLLTYQRRRRLAYLGLALLHVVLLTRLTSTTGTVYAAIATLQVAMVLLARARRMTIPLAAASAILIVVGMLVFESTTSAFFERARAAVVGDKIRGLAARYASDGLLAVNVAYLSQHPLEPVGFGYSERLYYADSGYVVNMLRGSVPLMATMYGGLLLFLVSNLASKRTAVWIAFVILVFEIGFTPLQYFRFLGFAPFMIVYLNSLFAAPAAIDRPDHV